MFKLIFILLFITSLPSISSYQIEIIEIGCKKYENGNCLETCREGEADCNEHNENLLCEYGYFLFIL